MAWRRLSDAALPRTMPVRLTWIPAVGLAPSAGEHARSILIDLRAPTIPRSIMPAMSIGSDFPGTLERDDSPAQWRIVQRELGFRDIRFHNVFVDQLGVYRLVDGKPVYDRTRIDRLYDRLLALKLKPFVAWRDVLPGQPVSNLPFFTRVCPAAVVLPLAVTIAELAPGRYTARVRWTGFRRNDGYTACLEMGRPATWSGAQIARLQALTADRPETRIVTVGQDGRAAIGLPMRDHDVVIVEIDRP